LTPRFNDDNLWESMNKKNPSVDGYIRKQKAWQDELTELRRIILDSELTEDVKWRVPCYTLGGKNVLFIGPFKEAAVLSFVKGVLLKDPKKILIQQTENSQSVRIIRFTSVGEIRKLEPAIKAFIEEAIENEKGGLKVKLKTTSEFKVPQELQAKFKESPALKTAFRSLTPGRQRAYLLHFAGAKQSKTREARIEKHAKRILEGKGLDDE
jgi:uncharacterized protein YdeI (YjbR/CyaY-like superfamily)